MKKISKNSAYSIMYHYVREERANKYKDLKFLDFKKFKKQINYFATNFDILSLDDFSQAIKKKTKNNKPPLLLTFDDGYKDHYQYVFPFLLKKKLKGLFYPPARILEKKFLLDVNKIHFILSEVNDKKIIIKEIKRYLEIKTNLSYEKLNLKKISLNSRFDNKETILIKRLLQYYLPKKIRTSLNNHLFKKFANKDMKELSDELYLKSTHIDEMYNSGMHFGSHGFNHEWLEFLDKKEQEFEISKSYKFLKTINKKNEILSICYPYGSHNTTTLKLLKKYKFEFGFTSKPGVINLEKKNNNLLIPRFDTNDFHV